MPSALHTPPTTTSLVSDFWTDQIKTACMCYYLITGSTPSYLSELLQLYSPSHSLRSSSDTCIPKLQCFNLKTHGFHFFSNFSPHIRNNLTQTPDTLRLSPFKNKLKTLFFSEHFNWVILSFTPTVCIPFVCTRVYACVCTVIYACTTLSSCVDVQILFSFFYDIHISNYMYVFNLYCSALWATG